MSDPAANASGADDLIPGQVLLAPGAVAICAEPTVELAVLNTGDRPIQVGSHYHFAEANPALSFDRAASHGCRLAIASGTAVRFEPGIERRVGLVPLRGNRRVPGLRGAVGGALDGDGESTSAIS
ncbi:MAG: urease subunit beta [Acidimicrobiaceae bacterium]|nr:urease subunit beta [Acidimicrobiaceae bacterium]